MFVRDAVDAGPAGRAALLLRPDFGLRVPVPVARAGFAVEAGLLDSVCFVDFRTGFLAVFLAGFFLAAFFALRAVLFGLPARALLFFARFFDAVALALRFDAFLAFFFFEDFFPETTTYSLDASKQDFSD
jgi:hypothetical protein